MSTIELTPEEIAAASDWDCTPLEFWTCCGVKRVVDLTSRGTTLGGLDVIGGLVCPTCGYASLCKGITREAFIVADGKPTAESLARAKCAGLP